MSAMTGRRLDVLCVGEALVDFLPDSRGGRVRSVERWTRCPGGSPSNVAIGLARLGAQAAFLGVVGEDEFGHFLKESLASEGVDVGWLRQTPAARTGLVFVSVAEDGERTFAFFRKPSAELLLVPDDVLRADLHEARVVHFGTNSLLEPAAAQAARILVREARARGCVVSCDPNLRLHVWDDQQVLRALLGELLPSCDIVKLAEDEAEFCTGERDPERAARALGAMGVHLAVITLGARGALLLRNGRLFEIETPQVEVGDATGAGDGFVAGLLSRIALALREGRSLESMSDEEIVRAASFGCRIGSLVVTQMGAVAGLPRLAEVG